MKYEVIPAILVEDFDEFEDRLAMAEDFAEIVQWDVMDGQFVEEMTFNDAKKIQQADLSMDMEAHLMVEHPEEMFDDLAAAGVVRVIIHAECCEELSDTIAKMRQHDFEVGIALNPETEVEDIEDIVDDVDEVMVMTVVPGAGGQSFMHEQLAKVRQLREMRSDLNIGVDGGLNLETIKLAKQAGANRFAVGTAIFTSPDPMNAYEVLVAAVESGV